VNEKLLKMLHFRQFITVSCCNCTADVAASISMDVSKRKRGERKKGGASFEIIGFCKNSELGFIY